MKGVGNLQFKRLCSINLLQQKLFTSKVQIKLKRMVSQSLLFILIFLDISDCSFIKFQIWDFPGHIDFCDSGFLSDSLFCESGAIIFVIDAQDDYMSALQRLTATVEYAYRRNPKIKYEVFIHKVDGLLDDQKIEIQRDIAQRVNNIVDDIVASCSHTVTDPSGVTLGWFPNYLFFILI